jgi:hypothetical protein
VGKKAESIIGVILCGKLPMLKLQECFCCFKVKIFIFLYQSNFYFKASPSMVDKSLLIDKLLIDNFSFLGKGLKLGQPIQY